MGQRQEKIKYGVKPEFRIIFAGQLARIFGESDPKPVFSAKSKAASQKLKFWKSLCVSVFTSCDLFAMLKVMTGKKFPSSAGRSSTANEGEACLPK
jgi:hypothetical protein